MSIEGSQGGIKWSDGPDTIVGQILHYAKMVDGPAPHDAGTAVLPKIPLERFDNDRPKEVAFDVNLQAYNEALQSPMLTLKGLVADLDATFIDREKSQESVRLIRFGGKLAVTITQRVDEYGTPVAFWPHIQLGPKGDQILADYGVAPKT